MDIKTVQQAILLVAKEIHRICEENGIQYTMIGGTFLGAIRHKGFIPWDDDMDFGMTWPDYKKFISVLETMDHPWLTYDIPSVENADYGKLFIKVYDSRTTFIEADKSGKARGVFVDIFPILGCGDSVREGGIRWTCYQFIRSLMDRKVYDIHEGDSWTVKDTLLKAISRLVPAKVLKKTVLGYYERMSRKRTRYSMIYDGSKRDILVSEHYDTPRVLYPFEDSAFYGAPDYDGWLTSVFGNYMELPPVEQRVSHHCKYVDLSTPYAEYKGR